MLFPPPPLLVALYLLPSRLDAVAVAVVVVAVSIVVVLGGLLPYLGGRLEPPLLNA